MNKARKKWKEAEKMASQSATKSQAPRVSYSRHCGEVVETTVKKVCEYLNMVVDEVQWSNRLNHYNCSPRDPLHRLYAHYLDGRWPWVAWGPRVG